MSLILVLFDRIKGVSARECRLSFGTDSAASQGTRLTRERQRGRANRTAKSPPKGPKPEDIVSKGGHLKVNPPEGHGDLHPPLWCSPD